MCVGMCSLVTQPIQHEDCRLTMDIPGNKFKCCVWMARGSWRRYCSAGGENDLLPAPRAIVKRCHSDRKIIPTPRSLLLANSEPPPLSRGEFRTGQKRRGNEVATTNDRGKLRKFISRFGTRFIYLFPLFSLAARQCCLVASKNRT